MSVQTREDQVREWMQRAMDASDRETVARYAAARATAQAAALVAAHQRLTASWWEPMPIYDQLADETGFLRQVEINQGRRINAWRA